MAEGATPELAEANSDPVNPVSEDMDLETTEPALNPEVRHDGDAAANGVDSAANGDSKAKRAREEGDKSEEEDDGVSKKQRVDKSVEEERLEKLEGEEGEEKQGPASVGPKSFSSSVEMFDYFYKFLHYWPPNLNVNKYEHMVLLDLLKKGHGEPDKKIGGGIQGFQVRYHPMWKSRCFFLIREDESVDDFSFRKCVDNILPLPEDMKMKSDVNKGHGVKSHGGRGGGRGRGRGRGKWRN